MKCVDRLTGEFVELVGYKSSRFVPVAIKKEPFDPSTHTERAYIPPQIQIADMMKAGLRLADERRVRFDSTELDVEEGGEIPLDPMREPGLDLADVSKLAEKAKKAATALQAQVVAKQKEVADAEEKAKLNAAVEAELARRAQEVKE